MIHEEYKRGCDGALMGLPPKSDIFDRNQYIQGYVDGSKARVAFLLDPKRPFVKG